MKALILAAGYAVRLYPLTKNRPKSLLPLGRKPIINYIIHSLDEAETLDTIYVVTNQKFYDIFEDWLKDFRSRKGIVLINDATTKDEDRLGALGDIELSIRWQGISDDLLVVAGDNIFDWSLKDFVTYAKEKPRAFAVGVYDIGDKTKASRYGVVEVDKEGFIAAFREKPKTPASSLVATGIYYFPGDKLNLVSEYLKVGKQTDAPGHFIHWLITDRRVRAYAFKGTWYDIGDKESYRKANLIFGRKKA